MNLASIVFAAILPMVAMRVTQETGPVYRFLPPRGGDVSLNQTARWDVTGADLGILWDGGIGCVYCIYGDSLPDDLGHRSDVLAFSIDRVLTDGMTLSAAIYDAPITPPRPFIGKA